MDIKDITGLSQPLTRLIEVISSGIGKVFSSHFIRKEADANAYAIRAIAQALNSVSSDFQLSVIYKDAKIEIWQKPDDATLLLNSSTIDERINSRIDYQERRKQKNIESITAKAAENLLEVENISESKPDEDWIARFFNYSQDISSKEMQELWGRILSGEIIRPGSYSLRTLDVIRNMTTGDAKAFEKLARYALKLVAARTWFIPIDDKSFLKTKFGIYPADQFNLSELNFMYPSDLALEPFADASQESLITTESNIMIIKKGIQEKIKLPIWKFTQIGGEIISLVEKPYNDEYFMHIANYFKNNQCVVIIGKITAMHTDGKIEYHILKEIKED